MNENKKENENLNFSIQNIPSSVPTPQFNYNTKLNIKPLEKNILRGSNLYSNNKEGYFDKESIGHLSKSLFKRAVEECASSIQSYQVMFEEYTKRNSVFTDYAFPANYTSLVRGLNQEDILKINQGVGNLKSIFSSYSVKSSNQENLNPKQSSLGNVGLRKISEEKFNEQTSSQYIEEVRTHNFSTVNVFNNNSENNIKQEEVKENSSEYLQDLVICQQWTKVVWKRASELFGEKYALFPTLNKVSDNRNILKNNNNYSSLINSNDLRQGMNKNTNFLSVVCSLAENPNRILNLFLSKKSNQQGIYGIKICYEGEWTEVVVDDYLPCDSKKKNLCFAAHVKDKTTYLWLSLFEKAYAKVYGSYYLAGKVDICQILRDLTGAPVVVFDNIKESLWNDIKIAYNKGYIILASAGETPSSRELLKDIGLMPFNAYTIIDAQEVDVEEGSTDFLLKIKNYWGINDCLGDWSQFSTLWKDEIKNKLNINPEKDAKDGIFWINYKDFKKYFSKLIVCKLNDDFSYESIKLNIEKPYYLIKLSIKEKDKENINHLNNNLVNNNNLNSNNTNIVDSGSNQINVFANSNSRFTKCIFSIIQKMNSLYLKNKNTTFSSVRFILCKINDSNSASVEEHNNKYNLLYLDGNSGESKEVLKKYFLTQGDYLVYLELDSCKSSKCPVFSCYSEKSCVLSTLEEEDYPNILHEIFKSAAIQNENKYYYTLQGAPGCFKVSKACNSGYYYIYYFNREDDTTLKEDIKFTSFSKLKLVSPHSGTSYNVSVEPFQEAIVLIKKEDMLNDIVNFSYSIK